MNYARLTPEQAQLMRSAAADLAREFAGVSAAKLSNAI
jgi:hypothetical protein